MMAPTEFGLGFITAGILHQNGPRAKLDSHLCQVSGCAPEKASESTEDAGPLLLGSLLRRVLHVHVRHLMSQDANQLRFVVGRIDGADVYENRTSRKREGIDVRLLNDVELVWPGVFVRNDGFEFLSQLLHVLRDRTGLWEHRHLLIDFGSGLEPKLLLLVLGHAGAARDRGARGPLWLGPATRERPSANLERAPAFGSEVRCS